MKMNKTFFVILFLILLGAAVWAQTIVYDTIVPKLRFSYSIGVRYMNESADFKGLGTPFFVSEDIFVLPKTMTYSKDSLGIFYLAEWRYFMLGAAPSFNRAYVKNDGENTDTIGADFQLLAKLPLVDSDFKFNVFGGPEVSFVNNLGFNAIAGFDIGHKITQHHALFLSFSAGTALYSLGGKIAKEFRPVGLQNTLDELVDYHRKNNQTSVPFLYFMKSFLMENLMEKQYFEKFSKVEGLPLKFQVSLGIRTLVYTSAYYFEGQQTGTRD